MEKIILGIDPDSTKNGVSEWQDSTMANLYSLNTMGLHDLILEIQGKCAEVEIHIEDVCAQNAAFVKSGVKNAKAGTAINRSIGKCQQAQIEVERLAEYHGIKVVKHKISKMWKCQNGKSQFEKVTGWKGRSNEDNRSAAYFGWLGVNSGKYVLS